MTARARAFSRLAGRAVAIAALIGFGVATPLAAQAAPSAKASSHVHVCPAPAHGFASCNALRNDAKGVAPAATAAPAGYGPTELRAAYGLASAAASNGASQTIAIVDAYDAPNAESDVNTYRTKFGIPTCTSTGSNPCFRKINQTGGTTPPRADGGWAQEISLDLDMASALCPNCHLLLVEATTSSMANLGTAVNTAASNGATVISNSYGGSESSADPGYDTKYFTHPGIPITVSSGDSGYGVQYPAASSNVVAVGGTSLSLSGSTRTETAWSGAGSGCSAYDPKPAGQTASTGCANRAVADVSAVADPNTGVAVYDSYRYQGRAGWMVFGGTSVAAPVIAGVYALAGNGAGSSALYSNASSLYDVTTGSNGSCNTAVWCNAGRGWDGPTGVGTPNGLTGF